jgi:acyl-CoA synthetase (NDP forming)
MEINFKGITRIFRSADNEGRNFLLEHEVYSILEDTGIKTPQYFFVKKGQRVNDRDLKNFKSQALVIKVVAPVIIHKTDVGGIRFVERNAAEINQACQEMMKTIPKKFRDWVMRFPESKEKGVPSQDKIKEEIKGFLICEMVEYDHTGFGTELLMGSRNTREFGPVVTMGVGGVEIEYLSERIKEGKAVSSPRKKRHHTHS